MLLSFLEYEIDIVFGWRRRMNIEFLNERADFRLLEADQSSGLYFPLANTSGVMAGITPRLHGDNKIDQNSFLMEPVSVENLHTTNMGRNVWFRLNREHVWAASGCAPMQEYATYGSSKDEIDQVWVEAGKLWHKLIRKNNELGVQLTIANYAPVGHRAEIMKVTINNIGDKAYELEPFVAIPIFGRSAANIRDHRHVTSLLHRIFVNELGIEVRPTLSFDERGHQENMTSYGVFAKDATGEKPVAFFPVMETFIGEGGNLNHPKVVMDSSYCEQVKMEEGEQIDGFEAIGAMQMKSSVLRPGESRIFFVVLSYDKEGIELLDSAKEEEAFHEHIRYWDEQTGIKVTTGNERYDKWLKWVCIQPTLRRIYGCSFLPHHDYGKGGRGYRDIWQDSLALLLNTRIPIREQLVNYFAGVRIDGSNATIIGSQPGEFVADRNSIVRVWMDHGVWPAITTLLYINQTGDTEILEEQVTYFKDSIIFRGKERDVLWEEEEKELHTKSNHVYTGNILEHILVQHLTAYYEVGEHGHLRLLDADWNDALDMAGERGESVAFSAAYAGNLENLGNLMLSIYDTKQMKETRLATEIVNILLNRKHLENENWKEKQEALRSYCNSCGSYISGEKERISLKELGVILLNMSDQVKELIREKEWIQKDEQYGWYNSYYDNHGKKVEGFFSSGTRMMLTGQVFAILSHTATDEQITMITKAADELLFNSNVGGYRLNTNFHEVKKDLGRMFGFAYGTKENGAVFSHMAVMYAYALYARGFVKEGYKVIEQLYKQSDNFEVSRIYPGIPEYFNQHGRGQYNYLTGAASWYMLTVLTQMFGLRGVLGNLLIDPKLMTSQFDENGKASIQSYFADREILVIFENPERKEIGDYEVEEIYLNDEKYEFEVDAMIQKNDLTALDKNQVHVIRIRLA